jgi:hypothetical protein
MKNLKTRNGLDVKKVGETKDLILGLIQGEKNFLAWDKNTGKRVNSKYNTKLDLCFSEPISAERFVVVKKWGKRISANVLEREPKQTKSVIKCIKITI